MITGYNDAFSRTVSGGFGTATSGQTYSLSGTAAQFSVSSGVGSVAMNAANTWLAYVDRQTADIDITGQVALSALPSSNNAFVGLSAKQSTNSNLYIGWLMVAATTGIMQLRISKIVGGTLSALTTIAVSGLGTYSAGTYFNLRFQAYWSNLLQTNILNLKIWAVGSTEPGGWLVTATDSSITQYTSGTQAGVVSRDEATTPSVTARWQNIAAKTYGLPVPALTDPMCNDPAVAYPDQTALQSLAVAADAAMVTLDPYASLAGLYPRVRVSANNVSYNTNNLAVIPFDTAEFNIGTTTNLSYDNQNIYLPSGVWLVTAEIKMVPAGFNTLYFELNGGPFAGQSEISIHSNATQGTLGVGGTGHLSSLTWVTSPTMPNTYSLGLGSFVTQSTYTITYAALSAIKISDYYT